MYQTRPWGRSVLNDGMKDDDKKFILLGRLQFPRFLYIQTLVTKGFSPIPMIKTSTWLPTRDFGSDCMEFTESFRHQPENTEVSKAHL